VVNNAGVSALSEIDMLPNAEFQKMMDVNVMGTVKVTKLCLPLLRQSKGRVVNVASVLGQGPRARARSP
jgi:NAD(P)-dependent dehydrogenase (short-subunit alcohol dehydrogenase family)